MINIDALNDDEKLAALESIHKSIAESKEIQKKKITTNVELIVKALKKIESDLKQRYDETGQLIANLKNGEDGRDGKDGKDGKNGRDGRDGPVGPRGYDGLPGRNGIDGTDGVSVTDAHIDFDGSLIISLSSGRVINVGEVVAADIAEKIKVITNGGGTSQGVLDAIASLQAQIDSIASGLEYQGTWNASTNVPTLTSSVGTAGYYYIVATAGSTNLNGVTDWQVGDWAVFNGSVWQKIDQTNLVTSVAGRTGAVTLSTSDISGLGTIATQAANNVSITGGSITGITDLAIADGGTGASTAAAAITALTGTQTSGYYLRSNGTSAALSAISAGDVPTLNQNTTGTAAGLSATLATSSGGTGLTSFTANGVVYASSTSALATGSALTFNGTTFVAPITSLSGNGVVLTVDRTGTGGNDRTNVQFSNSGTVRGGIGTVGASDGIYFNQGTTEGMRLTSTGLGIGTSSPSAKLDVTANAVVMGYFRSSGGLANDQRLTFTSAGGRVVLDAATNSTGASSAFGFTLGGTEGMRLTTTGLGIGTSSPAFPLDVQSTGTGSNIASRIYRSDGTIALLRIGNSTSGSASSAPAFGSDTTAAVIYTDNAERMRITSAGNLGLGVTPSAWSGYQALQIGSAGGLSMFGYANAAEFGNNYYYNAGYKYGATASSTNYVQTSGQHRWFTAPSGTAGNAITFTQAMTLDASGNLLVGLSSALTNGKLQIAGGIGLSGNTQIRQATNGDGNTLQVFATQFVASTTNSGSYVYTGGGLFASVASGDSQLLLDAGRQTSTDGRFKVANTTSANTSISLEKNGVTTLYANTSGNVGIGTSSPTSLLDLRGTLRIDGGGNSYIYSDASGVNFETVGARFTRFYTNSSERMRITSAGNVGIGTSSPNASAILDAQSTTKGVRMPNMTTTQKNAIASPAAGLMVFDTTLAKLCVYSGTAWETITSI